MIRNKKSFNKFVYEGYRKNFFVRDNLSLKIICIKKKQRFVNICKDYRLKKIIKKIKLFAPLININKI